MFKIRILILTLIILAGNSFLFSQDVRASFKKVNESFSKHPKLSYNLTYLYYSSTGSKKPDETMSGTYKKSGDSYYSRTETKEVIVNEKYRVIIDNETKHLVVENRQTVLQKDQLPVDIDSALGNCKKITSKKVNNSETYSMFFDTELYQYSEIDITINTSSGFITKIVFHLFEMNDAGEIINRPRVEILVTGHNTSPKITSQDFAEANYVKIDAKGTVSLTKKYSQFILLTPKVSLQ